MGHDISLPPRKCLSISILLMSSEFVFQAKTKQYSGCSQSHLSLSLDLPCSCSSTKPGFGGLPRYLYIQTIRAGAYSIVVVFFNNRTESATRSPLDSGHLLSKSPHVSSVRLCLFSFSFDILRSGFPRPSRTKSEASADHNTAYNSPPPSLFSRALFYDSLD